MNRVLFEIKTRIEHRCTLPTVINFDVLDLSFSYLWLLNRSIFHSSQRALTILEVWSRSRSGDCLITNFVKYQISPVRRFEVKRCEISNNSAAFMGIVDRLKLTVYHFKHLSLSTWFSSKDFGGFWRLDASSANFYWQTSFSFAFTNFHFDLWDKKKRRVKSKNNVGI